jgi:phosphoribosylaminoimidazole-succinocarboxamide synthase
MLDKEPTRQWLIERGFMGEGPVPEFTDEHRISISRRYIEAYELLTGQEFKPRGGDYLKEMESILKGLRG